MRNLKRALSLALACVMLLGMMVTGAGAASNSFTDFDKIVNQEAAEVTSGLGIFDGYTDGSFGPENVVTRAEMAVIICKLLNGSDVDPGNFAGISKFNDVPAWAEGYVNYCASMSIIVGVGEGKFNPSATVTTVEAATMLLKALGYYTEEDQLAADWKTVVTGRATSMHLYGELTLGVDEGLTRDNVAELVFNTLFAQRVAYDDNRHLYVKNTNRDVVVTNGTQDYLNTFAENTFGMWVVDGLVTANSYTNDDLSETTNNGNRTNVVFDTADAQDYPATVYQGSTGSEYPFEYTTGLDMIGHAARVYYKMERNAPVVYAIADRATKVEYVTYDSNETVLSDAANEAGFRRNTIRQISSDDYKVNYAWDVTVGTLKRDNDANNDVDLTGENKWDRNDPAKTLLVISNSTDYAVDYVILLDQYLDTVKRVATKNDVTEYDLTTIDGVDQNILHGDAAQGDYVIVTDIGKQGDMLNFAPAEKVSANITKITGKSDDVATVKSIVADGTTYVGSPVYDYRPQNSALDDTTDFEAIETIGEATLLLDVQGKCIGLAQPESTPNYAYAAQFGVWHTGGSLNTEFKLTVKLYFLDGTEGVYLVNTEDSASNNTFYNLKLGVDEDIAENYRDQLNGEDKANNIRYSPLKTYIPGNIGVAGNTLKAFDVTKESGLGIYKATVRADDTVVLKALGDHEAVSSTYGDETKLIPAHSTFVKSNGQNLTCPADNDVLFQNNKTVYFYVSGTYDDLSVGAKYGVANAVAITNSTHEKADVVGAAPATTRETNDKDNNGENDTFVQILTSDGGRKYEEKKETVEAVLIWGYDLGSSDTLYFYRQNSYDIEHKDNASSRAGEKLYTITYHMYTADGEPYEAHFDNGGKYYDMETAKETVSDKPTGYYKLASKDIEAQWASNETDKIFYVKNNKEIASADGAKNVYVLNAIAKHDTYVDNLYTHIEDVGGIIPSTAKVVSTVDNCSFDSINEIARACDNGALVKISYCYSTSDYKVKTVFITEYNKEGGTIANAGADLWSYYSAPWLYVFNNVEREASYIEVANSARAALEKAGYTVTNLQPAGLTGNGEIYWTMECTMGGVKYNFTNGPTGMGFGTSGFNYYVNIVRETVRVQINGNLASYNNGPIKEAYCVPGATIRVSNSTVATGNVYDVLVNDGANFAAANYGQVTAANNQITYALPNTIAAGYTVNFKSFEATTDAVISPDQAVIDKVGEGNTVNTVFDNNKNETPAAAGSTVKGELSIVAAAKALADGTFDADKTYTLTFRFSGTETTRVVTAVVKDSTTLTFEVTIPTNAKIDSDSGKIEITLIDLVESDGGEEGQVTLTTSLGTVAPDKITAAGDTTVTITVEPEANKSYSVTYNGTEYKAVEGVITIPVTVTQEQIDAGATIAFTVDVVTEQESDPTKQVKAKLATPDYDAGTVSITLGAWEKVNGTGTATPEQIKAALEAIEGVSAVAIDDSTAKITYNDNVLNATIPAAEKLYKVTYPGGEDYLGTNFTDISGVTAGVKYLIDASIDNTNTVINVTDGAATIAGVAKEMTYDEAFKFSGTAHTAGTFESTPGTSNTAVLTVGIKGANGTENLNLSTNNIIRKGAVLKLGLAAAVTATEGSTTLTIGGVETVISIENGAIDPNTATVTTGDASGNVTITVTTVAAPVKEYSVSMNGGTPVTMTGTDKHVFEGIPAGAKILCEKDGELAALAVGGSPVASAYGEYNYTLAAGDASTGTTEIKLFTVWEVNCSTQTGFELYDTNPVGAAEAPTKLSDTKQYKTIEAPTLYLLATLKNVYMVPKAALKNTALDTVRVPSQNNTAGFGVWSFTLGENIANSFGAAVTVASEVKFAPATKIETPTGATSSAVVVTIASAHSSLVKSVEPTWAPADAKFAGTMTVESDGKIKLVPTAEIAANDIADGTTMGTLTVKITLTNGDVMSTVFTVKAAS